MRVVITGSKSFVGKELISQCKKQGIEVVGFDLPEGDIRSPNISELIPEGADALIHLAALSRDPDCKNKSYECFDINVMGTLNLMKAAVKKNVKQFIFASSEWVYESFAENEIKNEESIIDISRHTSEYALSKLVTEANLRQQFNNGFCAVTILRFGIIYGPREKNWAAVESIFNTVKMKDEVVVGSLKSSRRFVHISDIAAGIIKSIGLPGFNIINLVGDRVTTLGDIIEKSQLILGKKVKAMEGNPNQVSIRNPSNEKAKRLIQWEPKINLETGLRTLLMSDVAKDILRIRLSQMIVNENYKAGKFKIPIHLALGHESIAAAISHIMKNGDKLILSHRNIAYNLARLGKLKPILDEYLLQPSGLAGAKLGSMNLINPPRGIIYSSSILGNNFPVAAGVAMSEKVSSKNLTIVLGGDGSMEEGTFYESLTLFSTLNLAAFIVIENNEWSMSTHIKERRVNIDLERLCAAVNIKYVKLSGNDPYKYIDELNKLREYSLANETPVCVEVAVTTLGDWQLKNAEYPNGKFINYHSGPAPTVDLNVGSALIRNNNEDPIFVLQNILGQKEVEELSKNILQELNNELK